MAADRVDALRRALELSPDNHELRLLLAAALDEAGEHAAAAAEYRSLAEQELLPRDRLIEAGRAALQAGDVVLATWFADRAREAGEIDGVADLQRDVDTSLGVEAVVRVAGPSADPSAPAVELERGIPVTFDDIGGLDEIKKAINRTIILPYRRPELYERYGRRAGGGVLLYGPPGCGKTMLARATAGECGLPFSNVRIEEILDPFIGVSERNLHDVFVQARERGAVRAVPRRAGRDRLRAPQAHRERGRGRSSTSCSRSSTRSAPRTRASSSSPRRTRPGTSTRRRSARAASTGSCSCRRPTSRRASGSSS